MSLAKARQRRDKARKQLADGIDLGAAKREQEQAQADAAANTFEAVGRNWLTKTAAKRQAITQLKVKTWLEKDVFPFIGKLPISTIGPRDVLERVIRKLEARGAIDTAHRVKQLCGQVFRFAVVSGLAERDVTGWETRRRKTASVPAGSNIIGHHCNYGCQAHAKRLRPSNWETSCANPVCRWPFPF